MHTFSSLRWCTGDLGSLSWFSKGLGPAVVTCHCSLCRLVPRCGVLEVQAACDQVLDWHGLQVPLPAETWLQMQTLIDYQQTRRKPKSCFFDEKYPFRQEGQKFQCWSSFLGLRIFGSIFFGLRFIGVVFWFGEWYLEEFFWVSTDGEVNGFSATTIRPWSGHVCVSEVFQVNFLIQGFLIYIIILSL